MLGASSTAQAGMQSTAANLGETIGKMGKSVAEIRGVEFESAYRVNVRSSPLTLARPATRSA
jgi:uncharacterized protein YhbP (UPF0306 family)